MKDALGAVQSVLVLGGSSDIALATAKKLVEQRARTVILAGRTPAALEAAASELEKGGADTVEAVAFDALDFDSHDAFVDEIFSKHGGFDLVVLAFGLLGDQQADEANFKSAIEVVQSNYTGAVSVLLPVAHRLKQQGHGSIVVLSSVAGERARAANFIYGSSKAGLDAFAQGLGDSLVGTGVSVMVVRPGFVKSKMTAHMDAKPMATTPDAVADSIVRSLGTGSDIVWVPGYLRWVFSIFRHLPRPVFRRIRG